MDCPQDVEERLISTDGERDLEKPVQTPFIVYLSVALACLNSFLLGYDIGIMSGAIIFIKDYFGFNDTQKEIIVGSLNVIAGPGALACGYFADIMGRKRCIMLTSALFVTGALAMAFAQGFWSLLAGRIITGIGIGGGLIIAPLYCSEITPAHLRGSLVSMAEISINFGILVGYAMNYALRSVDADVNWRYMLGSGMLPPILIIFTIALLPESPRWLVTKDRGESALESLRRVNTSDDEAQAELMEIKKSCEEENGTWSDIFFPTPANRRMILAAVGIHFFQQASGTEALVYYTPDLLKKAGLDDNSKILLAVVGIGFCKFIFILVATLNLDRFGRRPLILTSASLITITLAMLAFVQISLSYAITCLCLYMASFSIGFGPGAWVVATEIMPTTIRGKGFSLATLLNRVASGVITLTFFSFVHLIGLQGVFFFYAGVSALSVMFVYYFIPETKQKTLEEITTYFKRLAREKEEEPLLKVVEGE